MRSGITRHYLVACDFDQTLSLNDSGIVLSDLIGVLDFQGKVSGLSNIHLVQQGAELAYLLRHDPEFRCVRRAHLVEAGKRVHLKKDIARSKASSRQSISTERSSTTIRPRTKSARSGRCRPDTARSSCSRSSRRSYRSAPIVQMYVGDGSSDVHVMLHVNKRDGFTVAVSETKHVTRIASRTVLGSTVLSVLVPILEVVLAWDAARIRGLFESYGLVLQEWDKARTDWVTVEAYPLTSVEVE